MQALAERNTKSVFALRIIYGYSNKHKDVIIFQYFSLSRETLGSLLPTPVGKLECQSNFRTWSQRVKIERNELSPKCLFFAIK